MKVDYTGKRFGSLIAVKKLEKFISNNLRTHGQYLCLCDCGTFVNKLTQHLKSGYSLHCGCQGSARGKHKRNK